MEGDGARGGGDVSVGGVGEPRVGVSVWGEATVRGGVNISSGGTQTVMSGGSSGSGRGPSSWGAGGWRTPGGTPACAAPSAFCTTALCLRGGVVGGAPAAGGSSCPTGVWVDRLEATFSGTGTGMVMSLAGAAWASVGSKGRCESGRERGASGALVPKALRGESPRTRGPPEHPRGHSPTPSPTAIPRPTGQGWLTCRLKMHLPRGVAVGPLPGFVDTGHPKLGSAPGGQFRHVEVAVDDASADDLPLMLPCRRGGNVRWGQTRGSLLSPTPTWDPRGQQGH